MPATTPVPTIDELRQAFDAAVSSSRAAADAHLGAFYDYLGGVGAICFRRLAQRDQGESQGLYFETASEDQLDRYLSSRFPRYARIENTPGRGYVVLQRPTAAAGQGIIYEGARILVASTGEDAQRTYMVSENWYVESTSLLERVPVRATVDGPAGAIDSHESTSRILRLEDALWDLSWTAMELICGKGTVRERNEEVIARLRESRRKGRPGFEDAIVARLMQAGAQKVVLIRSDYLGEDNDYGDNRAYVSDSNFETPAELLLACRLALDSIVVMGTGVQALPITNTVIGVKAVVEFWQAPESSDMSVAREAWRGAVLEYFEGRENPFLWSENAVRGAMLRAFGRGVHRITLTPSLPAPTAASVFSEALNRYRLDPSGLTIEMTGPGG